MRRLKKREKAWMLKYKKNKINKDQSATASSSNNYPTISNNSWLNNNNFNFNNSNLFPPNNLTNN